MSGRRSRATPDPVAVKPVALEPSGLSTDATEVARNAAERQADLRAERWLLVREVVIVLGVATVAVALRTATA